MYTTFQGAKMTTPSPIDAAVSEIKELVSEWSTKHNMLALGLVSVDGVDPSIVEDLSEPLL